MTDKYIIDEVEDAYGNLTIRAVDGTPNGDTEQQPIATVYGAEHADLIIKAVNSHDALVAAIEKLYSYIDYVTFVNERTDEADFIDAILEQVK